MAQYTPDATTVYEAEVDNLILSLKGNTILSGCAVTALGTPSMAVQTAVGEMRWGGAHVDVPADTSITISAADASNSRIDVLYVDSAGVTAVQTGAAAATPKPPSLPSNSLLLAYITVSAGTTTIQNANISDRRIIAGDGAMQGLASARPAASEVPAGTVWLSTDTNGGTLYIQTGGSWVAAAQGVTEKISHDHSAAADGTTLTPATLNVPSAASPAQTAEGQMVWDSDDDVLTIGDGSSRKTMVDLAKAQTLTNKTLTAPTIADFTNAAHDHGDADDGGTLVAAAVNNLTLTGMTLTSPTVNTQLTGTAVGTGASQVAQGSHTTPAASVSAAGHMEVNDKRLLAYYSAGNSGASLTIDWNNGASQHVTMTGNCTFTFSNPAQPGWYALRLAQDATGSRTATWPATVKWSGATAPTLTTTASRVDLITFYWDGAAYLGASILNYNV